MREEEWLDEKIRACPIYEPGLPIETVARNLGLDPAKIVKLASNENPLGPSPRAVEAVSRCLQSLHDYPDGGTFRFREKLSQKLGLDPSQILPGNGSNEILEMLATAYLKPGQNAVFGQYGFVVYRLATLHAKAEMRPAAMPDLVHDLDKMRELIDEDTRLVFLANPNNPTGDFLEPEKIISFVKSLPEQVLFCLDEAYVDYSEDPVDLRPLIREGRRVICMRTFSKIHGLAGLRIGYAYSTPEVIANLQRVRQPFNVSSAAQAGALGALDDEEHQIKTRKLNRESLDYLEGALQSLGVPVRRTQANFVLIEVPSGKDCFDSLLREGVIVRPLGGYGLPKHIRVSTGTMEQNQLFMEVFSRWFHNLK
ncbi:histidinol-phosphate transaminase [Puniceicoccus vermicola]|uniref:Histidinol-phosphate aminotransferase n=1 Tax=Puniceicoccus vermicola TaxID=388746 RepID=A0A7X1E3W5_9BACT|nr:histidinol-phosphate transaminase [Puniceicoccus vermicola]MBC2601414.1 histidinol-phosphate transaminase [Puniceicoccus vermicola]